MKRIIVIVTDDDIVGSKYRPEDNSFSKDLTHGTDHPRVFGRILILTSKPYKKQVHEDILLREFGEYYRLMVRAIDPHTGFEYEIMYEPDWLV